VQTACVNEKWAFELGEDRLTRVLHEGNDSVPRSSLQPHSHSFQKFVGVK
jgi:hypothetical protein